MYATDIEAGYDLDNDFIEFMKNADVLIHDAQYTSSDYTNLKNPKKGFGHSTFEMAIETKERSNSKNLYFFHYDPEYDDSKLSNLEKNLAGETIHFAKENDEIII